VGTTPALQEDCEPPWLFPVVKLYGVVMLCMAFVVIGSEWMGIYTREIWALCVFAVATSLLTLLGVLLAHASRLRFICFLAGFFVISYASSFQTRDQVPVLVFLGIHILGIAIPLKMLRVNLRRVPSSAPSPPHTRQFAIADLIAWTAAVACLIGSLRWLLSSPHLNHLLPAATLGIPVGLMAIWAGVRGQKRLVVRASLLMLVASLTGILWNARDPVATYVLIVDGCLVAMTLMMVTYRPSELEAAS